HKVTANAERAGSGFEKARSGIKRHAAGRDQFEVREGRQQGLQITSSAYRRAGENLDVVRAGPPCGDDFSGSERAGDGKLTQFTGLGNDLRMEAGAEDKLRASLDG